MLEQTARDDDSATPADADERSYIAFISYRHKPLDKKAAELIQKRVESYVVPKEYRDRVGGKKLGMVFRDEDELPASSSLSHSITYALDRSQYLLVICTPDLPKSKYCEAEIRYFLETHDRDHVLAILVDGEPEEAFSPLLLYTYDEEGNVTGDVEPLAANISSPDHTINRKAVRKEIVRVYAALLGCPFDALWQRERRARTTRAFAAMGVCMAILLAFVGMVLSKNAEIHRNLMASYTNTARAYALDDDSDEALAYYTKVLESDPDSESAKLGALIELQRKQWIVEEEEARQSAPTDDETLDDTWPVLATSGNGLVASFDVEKESIVISDGPDGKVLASMVFHYGIVGCEFDATGNRLKVEHYSSSDWGDTGKMVTIYDINGTVLGESEKNVRYDIVGDDFTSDGTAVLWADTRSLRLLDGFQARSVTAPTWTQAHLSDAHMLEDGHIVARGEDDSVHEYRVVDFSGAADAASQSSADASQATSVVVNDEADAILLLDADGKVLDRMSLERLGVSDYGAATKLFEERTNQKVYALVHDGTRRRVFCLGLSDGGAGFAEPYALDFDEEREVLTCAPYPGGIAVAMTGATIYLFHEGDEEPYREINPSHGTYIGKLAASQNGQLAVEMWHERRDNKVFNYIELWDVETATQIANLDVYDSNGYQSGNLAFNAEGTQLSYTLTTTPYSYSQHDRENDIRLRTWALVAPKPDAATLSMLRDLNSYELRDDLTVTVKDARFDGDAGNWASLLDVSYPYEEA